MWQNILFDLDGTLTDSAPGIMESVAYALSKFGITDPNPDVLRRFIGPPLRDSFTALYGFTSEQCSLGIQYYREFFTAGAMFHNAVYPGIPELLKLLHGTGKRLIVATSKPEPQSQRILEYFDLLRWFDFLGGATPDESRCRKSDVIAYTLQQCGITDPASTVMIGDRSNDVEGAAANGISCIGVLYGYGSRDELAKAGASVFADSVEHLQRLLIGDL